jgi:hypothetical protein
VIVATALQILCRHSCLESGLAAPAMHRPQFVLFGDSLTQHSFDEGTLAALGDDCKHNTRLVLSTTLTPFSRVTTTTHACRRVGGTPCQSVPAQGEGG